MPIPRPPLCRLFHTTPHNFSQVVDHTDARVVAAERAFAKFLSQHADVQISRLEQRMDRVLGPEVEVANWVRNRFIKEVNQRNRRALHLRGVLDDDPVSIDIATLKAALGENRPQEAIRTAKK
eukprot:TRINITY_DN3879_c0_g1_i1.p2 TRINITY_DN3879_c0_g1~~TRINITY_DN3879_c0_g1_i1.p2  ORF type:complete len:123 (+),score=14.69 TRINITY_DN3879_c0_g1_i1:28-396(+)